MFCKVRAARMPVRVVWRFLLTAATLVPIREFRSWDLPALGKPHIAMSRRFRGSSTSGGVVENRWMDRGADWQMEARCVCNDGDAIILWYGKNPLLNRLRCRAIMI